MPREICACRHALDTPKYPEALSRIVFGLRGLLSRQMCARACGTNAGSHAQRPLIACSALPHTCRRLAPGPHSVCTLRILWLLPGREWDSLYRRLWQLDALWAIRWHPSRPLWPPVHPLPPSLDYNTAPPGHTSSAPCPSIISHH